VKDVASPASEPPRPLAAENDIAGFSQALPWLAAVTASIATAAIAAPLSELLAPTNIAMLFLLTVLLVALYAGRGPAVLCSFLNVVLFDYFFVPPRFSLAVADAQYLVTFAVMLLVALITTHLTADLRHHAELARRRERDMRAFFELARDMAGALNLEQVAEIAKAFLQREADAIALAVLVPDASGALQPLHPGPIGIAGTDLKFAQRVCDSGKPAGVLGLGGADVCLHYLPLATPTRSRGTMVVSRPNRRAEPNLLETVASLVAIAAERLHYVEVAARSELAMEAERQRNAILATVSHDLRTPLTALIGLADSLATAEPGLTPRARDSAAAIRDQATRLHRMVCNLLDMAQIQGHALRLRKEWQLVEEVVGAAVRAMGTALSGHSLRLEIPPELPLIEMDAVLMERVICNLLDNAAKYSPPGGTIAIVARDLGSEIEIAVRDSGKGFTPGTEREVFGMFVRGRDGSVAGAGLGLAICRAIVEAHGGRIFAGNHSGGGGEVRLTLPAGKAPAIEDEESA
jgi:two-component system sensor histidine kinase KdpD